MKGIERIGRNNGLCPYSPYEDLPESSKVLSEKFNKLKPATSQSGYEHPYHEMVYHYNDVVDDMNKFSELSKDIFLLKMILILSFGNFLVTRTLMESLIALPIFNI